MIVEIKRKFSCTYGILEIEATHLGSDEQKLYTLIDSPQGAIVAYEGVDRRPNCSYHIVLEYEELPA